MNGEVFSEYVMVVVIVVVTLSLEWLIRKWKGSVGNGMGNLSVYSKRRGEEGMQSSSSEYSGGVV